MAENRKIIQLHKKGDKDDKWTPLTTGECVQLTNYKNDGVTSGTITNAVDDANGNFDNLNTALMKLENRKANTNELADVAFSGSYNDLEDKPELENTQADWDEDDSDEPSYIKNKPSAFSGATNSANGTSGLVPQPNSGDEEKFLKGDGMWATIELPESMTFEGTVGSGVTINGTTTNATESSLPSATKSKVGHFYKVLGTYTYGGNNGITGDVFICAKRSSSYEWVYIPSGDDNYNVVSVGIDGLCPSLPNESNTTKFLKGDGTWATPPDTDTNTFRPIKVNGTQKLADNVNTALDLVAGNNITLNESNGAVTINATNVTIADNLTTNDSSQVLSAKQGKILNDTKASKQIDEALNGVVIAIKSGYNYTTPFNMSLASLTITYDSTNPNGMGDLETNIRFVVGSSAFTFTPPTGAKYVDAIPQWENGHEYIISVYKGLFVFGEVFSFDNNNS